MLQNIAIYPFERDVFYREAQDSCYDTTTFLVQYTTLEIPFEILSSLIFGVLAAYADNLTRTPQMFLIASFNCFCIINCGESLGIMFCTLFSHVGFAVNITSTLLSIATILGGVMSLDVNVVLKSLNYLSPVKYLVKNLAVYGMREQMFHCTAEQLLGDGTCPIENGKQVLELYGLDGNGGLNVLGLGICVLVYRAVAWGVVRVRMFFLTG